MGTESAVKMETFDSTALRVPGEDGVYFCARHKTVKTRLRCGRCEKPICPKCTIFGPTGTRCGDCASNRSSHIYQVGPKQYAIAFGAALGLGAVGAFLSSVLGTWAIWLLLYAPAIVPVLGRLVTRITGGKRGPKLATVVSLGLFCGAMLVVAGEILATFSAVNTEFQPVPLPPGAATSPLHPALSGLLLMAILGHPFLWIFLVVAIVGVWLWLK